MEVKHKTGGCVEQMGCVFSLGLLPIMLWMRRQQMPVELTETEMILKNGTHVPWGDFTHLSAGKMYLKNSTISIGTWYVLKHLNGKVSFDSSKIVNAQGVIQFILAHLPSSVVNPTRQ